MDGSGGGFGRLEEATRTVLAMEEPLQALVVTGREEALEARLRQLAAGRESRIKVFGYVDNVRQLMAAADFLVTKAGGLTLGEALAAELPVICFGSLPGQEARNERFAAMAGVALVASSGAQLQRVIGAALRDPVLLRNIRERIRRYRRPQAAAEIVEMVLTGRGLARGTRLVTGAAWLLAAPAVWGTYTWGAHLLALRQRLARAAHRARGRADLRRRPRCRRIRREILDVLARERVKAAFFLIGERAEAAPDIARRIAAEGHDLGNHTWSHRSLWLCGPAETRWQIGRGHDAIAAASGTRPALLPPALGPDQPRRVRRASTPRHAVRLLDGAARRPPRRGPRGPGPPRAARVSPGAIVDLHDADGVPGAGARLAQALPALIDALRQRASHWPHSATCCKILPHSTPRRRAKDGRGSSLQEPRLAGRHRPLRRPRHDEGGRILRRGPGAAADRRRP